LNSYEKITSNAIQLIRPGQFKSVQIKHQLEENDVVVEPYLVSVCHADLRYFTGQRRQSALDEKLPMALFHEGIGKVKVSGNKKFEKGDRVVIVPSIPGYVLNNIDRDKCCEHCRNGGDPNYCTNGVFLGSGYDGLAQSKLVISGSNLVKIPDEIKDEFAILSELISVSLYAINQINLEELSNEKVAVFGDGPVGYLTAVTLHYIFGVSKERLLVFGADPLKITEFEDFATTNLVHDYNFEQVNGVKTIFECTGGRFSSSAINQAIDLIDRQGTLILMGVTEELVPINTRDVLEKGIRLIGSSRSTTKEFEQLIDAFKNEEYRNALQALIPDNSYHVRKPDDLKYAMNKASEHTSWRKIYIGLEW